MKNVYLKYICFLLLGFNAYSQGSDVIFWVDNSGSVDNTEYTQMSNSIQAIMQNVIDCNPDNRVTVIQYGSQGTGVNSRIWIESDFSNAPFVFPRRSGVIGSGDFAHEALGLIGNAIDHIANPNIFGTAFINRTPGNSLVIYLFTDASRAATGNNGSCLVSETSTGTGTNGAFQNYTDFKNLRGVKFVVTLVSPTASAIQASAAIASQGGTYTGIVESYPLDPDGSGLPPRFLLNKTNFILTTAEINNTTEQICSIAVDPCVADLVLVSPTHNVAASIQDNRQASNSITASNVISNLGVGVYHAKNTIVLKPGFHGVNGSRFRGYIQDCPSDFVGRDADNSEKELSSNLEKLEIFPNPSSNLVTVALNNSLIQQISILSLDGRVMFDKVIGGVEKYEFSINDYKEGLYLVTVLANDGKILKSKLVKN